MFFLHFAVFVKFWHKV